MSANVGWQEDGSYVPCPVCEYVPPIDRSDAPGYAMPLFPRQPGTTVHRAACSTVAMTVEQQRSLAARVDEMDRVRRRGAAVAWQSVIG